MTLTTAANLTRTWTCVLFDLDGTITDSAPGITASLAETFRRLSMPVPAPADLMRYVGPPLLDSFRDFAGLDPAATLSAADLYRTVSTERGSDFAGNAVFPGVEQVLASLAEAGVPIGLATSKPEWRARDILAHFGLTRYFAEITGASIDESLSSKADVVAEALRRLGTAGVDLSRVVMVGDRSHDVVGAAANDVPTILAGWGYGTPPESAGTLAVAENPELLTRLLLG